MDFRQVRHDELLKVYDLYRSVIGNQFCVWNELYPGMDEIQHDFQTGNLFVIVESEQIIGAGSIVPENEMDSLPFWKTTDGTEREIARIVIANEFQGKGLAIKLVNSMLGVLKQRGCTAVHLSVADVNIPALKTYRRAGFEIAGKTEMYNNHYHLLEKTIS